MHPTARRLCALAIGMALHALPVAAADTETLEAENARLRARVEELERENAQLRGEARAAEPALPARVVEKVGDDGTPMWATAPATIDATGRPEHWLWIERSPGRPGGTLWIRTGFSGGIYRYSKELELDVGGTTYRLPVTSYDATRISTGGARSPQRRDHELVGAALSPEAIAALAGASALRGRLGRTTFTVPAEALASIRALARKTT
jgi:hypothetical protein